MNEPKNQHYIPQSYLRNFSEKKGMEYFVYVRNAGEKFHLTNIRNICSEKDFYSIPNATAEDTNIIEKYYANNIDNLFTEVTSIITDENITKINLETRKKIITACLSLYLRTPKFLNSYNLKSVSVINAMKKYFFKNSGIYSIDFYGKQIEIKKDDLEKLESDVKKENKILFLNEHLEILNRFINFKINDDIGVQKIVDDTEFITSDNPVIISNPNRLTNIFDKENMIQLPINSKYLLTIYPKSISTNQNTISRIDGNYRSTLTINDSVEKNSDRWIIGTKTNIDRLINDQIKYSEPSDTNEKIVIDYEDGIKLLTKFHAILDKKKGISKELLDHLRILMTNNLLKDDTNLLKVIKEIKAMGYDI
jgi:hypothetical protein